jgi:hypothetical protein
MTKKQFISIFAIAVIASIQAPVGHGFLLQQKRARDSEKVDFRYIIFKNDARYFGKSEPKAGIRTMRVLLDEGAFSEETLKKLFRALSEKYPEPQMLLVVVITNIEQTYPPGYPQSSTDRDPPEFDNHHWANYTRSEENEYFRYNPDPPNREMKTVVLKGKDPFAPQAQH